MGWYKQWIRGAGPAGTWDPWGPTLLFSWNVIELATEPRYSYKLSKAI